MSEVFEFEYNVLQEMLIVNHQDGFSYNMCDEDDVFSVATKLNEQQANISALEKEIKELKEKLDDVLELTEFVGMTSLRKAEIKSIVNR